MNDLRPLTETQMDGRACVVCGLSLGRLVPVQGVMSCYGSQLFRHPDCAVDEAELEKRVELPVIEDDE